MKRKLLAWIAIPLVVLAMIAAVPGPPSTPFTRSFLQATNASQAASLLGISGGGNTATNPTTIQYFQTNITDIALTTNNFFLSGKGNTLVITQIVQHAWSTLTMSGSNVSAPNLTNATLFRLDLTNNGFLPSPINFPGTNFGSAFQIHVKQDSAGTRSLMATNSAWVVSGSGTSTNAVLGVNTNANAVTVLTFATSPFDATKVYQVVTPF